MNNIYIVPDVHGRTFWKDVLTKDYDKVIFLGDYLDPYDFEMDDKEYSFAEKRDPITIESCIDNFKEIIEFKQQNPDKVVLLLGNHDLHYFNDLSDWYIYKCRCITSHYDEIKSLFEDNKDLFKLVHIEDGILYSHAGLTKGFYEWVISRIKSDKYPDDMDFKDIDFIFNKFVWNFNLQKYVWVISSSRGGRNRYGSIVWADAHEHDFFDDDELNNSLGIKYQIFGHTINYPNYTNIDIPEIDEAWAMLDSRQIFSLQEIRKGDS